ncbi:hypothetical protein BDV59DRAFT_198207 [Aspergillus ambiguus]|uniref:uncharacterized protein n=1 Tax=Aspergillus ambiguus TaxID=176160 RepID=UPI003CCE1686
MRTNMVVAILVSLALAALGFLYILRLYLIAAARAKIYDLENHPHGPRARPTRNKKRPGPSCKKGNQKKQNKKNVQQQKKGNKQKEKKKEGTPAVETSIQWPPSSPSPIASVDLIDSQPQEQTDTVQPSDAFQEWSQNDHQQPANEDQGQPAQSGGWQAVDGMAQQQSGEQDAKGQDKQPSQFREQEMKKIIDDDSKW